MKRQQLLKIALLGMIFSACALSSARAEFYYFDDFNTQLDPYWWTMSSSGSVTASYTTDYTNATNKLILMRYVPGSEGQGDLKFNFPAGNFSASITYNLVNWPAPDNNVTVGIRTDLGNVERLNNGAEIYLTDFLGDVPHSVGTDDRSGRLRIIRNGTLVQGAYYDSQVSNNWTLISQYNSAGTANTDITFSLWPEATAYQNVSVVFDDFNFHAYDATDPRQLVPEPLSMLLFGVGATAMAVSRRKKRKTV
jgi:hypothetical protein